MARARKKAPAEKKPLPAKRPPASKVDVPKDCLTGVTKTDHTVSQRISYFIRELGEFESQVADLEDNCFVLKKGATPDGKFFQSDHAKTVEELKRKCEFLVKENKELNDDCVKSDDMVFKLQCKLHDLKQKCGVPECDECESPDDGPEKSPRDYEEEDEDREITTTTCSGCHNDFPDNEMMPADDKEGEFCQMCWKDGKAAA